MVDDCQTPDCYIGVTLAQVRAFMEERCADPRAAALIEKIARSVELVAELKAVRTALAVANADMAELYSNLEEAKEAVEQVSLAKSRFLATMSHEIRTPMNGVLGMMDLLSRTPLATRQMEMVETARRSGESLLSIINDTLDLSKIEADRLELEEIDLDLHDIVEDVIELFSAQAIDKDLVLTSVVSADAETKLRGDPTRIRQVISNLVANAVKFTTEGSVAVRVRTTRSEGDVLVHIDVVDTGPGIDPHVLPRLFNAFTQADSSTTRRFGGTGLGLAIVRRLCVLMGGSATIESTPGVGSTFRCQLKVKAQESPEATRPLEGRLVCLAIANVVEREGVSEEVRRLGGALVGEGGTVHIESVGHSFAVSSTEDPAQTVLLCKPLRRARLQSACDEILRAKALEPAEQMAELDPSKLTGRRVLLVEDNLINSEVAMAMLESFGCEVTSAVTGLEACDVMLSAAFDVVLMDCQMPVMDGYDATREIRKRETGPDRTPIIALTANALAEDRQACLSAGMDDFVTKPLSQEELERALLRWI